MSVLSSFFDSVGRNNSKQMILLGNFNVNMFDLGYSNVNILSDFLRTYYFIPIITNATRLSPIENIRPSVLNQLG